MYIPSEDNAVCLRLLRPGFEYPTGVFQHHDALYYPSRDVVFLVTKRQSSNYGDDVYTEITIWDPDEIRLLGTLTLSIPEGGGWVVYAPWHYSIIHHIPLNSDLSSNDIIETCLEAANKIVTENKDSSGTEYLLRTVSRSDPNIEKELFENIDLRNSTLMRGLYTLIKSPLLMTAPDFMEEAFMNLQISREAALQIIRDHLRESGNPNPSYKHAHDYIRSHFHFGKELVEYLEEQHEKWVETKHPVSFIGSGWSPSLWADDVYETYECLISIYRHIVLGELGRSSTIMPTL